VLLLILIFSVLFYFLPFLIVLCNKRHGNKIGLFLVNLVFGWSFIGWILCLVWAFQRSHPEPVQVTVNAPHNVHGQEHVPLSSAPSLPAPQQWQGYLYCDGNLLRQFSVPTRPLVIGRGEESDIRIDDPQISGRHWQIEATADGIELKDLDSTNGTWKHGRVRTDWDLANEGDWYQVGVVQLAFRRG
jgi:hypothetical protein